MFINFSNHPSTQWASEQEQAAKCYGEIRDIPFPEVPSEATTQEVAGMADNYARKIMQLHPECVMCQGEFTLVISVIRRLQAAGIRCVCACSERRVIEERLDDGTTRKTMIFKFCQFRECESP